MGTFTEDQRHLCSHEVVMAIRKNADGTITVGIIPEEKKVEKKVEEVKKASSTKKPTTKKKQ